MSVEITNMYLFVVAQYQEHNYAMFLGDLICNMCHLVVAQYQEYNYATYLSWRSNNYIEYTYIQRKNMLYSYT